MVQLRTLLVCLAVMIPPFGATALAEGPTAEDFVQRLARRAIAAASMPGAVTAARDSELFQIVEQDFDLNGIGQYVLAGHWPKADDAQRVEFLEAFASYLVVTYAGRLAEDPGARLAVTGSDTAVDGSMTVDSLMQHSDGDVHRIEWRLRRAGGTWRVFDMVIDGASLALTYREQFASVMRVNDGKLAMLSEKLRQRSQALTQ